LAFHREFNFLSKTETILNNNTMRGFGIPYIVEDILNANANGQKVLVVQGPHDDKETYDSKGEQLWGSCDGNDAYTAGVLASKCRGGNDPIDCFTFIDGDVQFDRYQLCGYCVDEVERTIQWRIEIAVILFHLGFSRDVRQLLLSYIDIETPVLTKG
jgi:hypothetical protein